MIGNDLSSLALAEEALPISHLTLTKKAGGAGGLFLKSLGLFLAFELPEAAEVNGLLDLGISMG
jgi:hypothetical protein